MPCIIKHLHSIVLQLLQKRYNVLFGGSKIVFEVISAFYFGTAGDLALIVPDKCICLTNQLYGIFVGKASGQQIKARAAAHWAHIHDIAAELGVSCVCSEKVLDCVH